MPAACRRSRAAHRLGQFLLPLIVALAGCASFTTTGHLIGGPPDTDSFSDGDADESSTDDEQSGNEHDWSHAVSGDGTVVPHFQSAAGESESLSESISPGRQGSTTDGSHRVMKPVRSNRLMIYSARFSVATATVNETIERFLEGVNAIGGYLESRIDNRVIVRVPAESFDGIVRGMPSLGDVLSRSVKNEDVTRKHRDLKLRLEALRISRQRMLELLKSADEIDDIVKLEERLAELTLQLEMAQGEHKTLSQQITYSRVEVEFRTKSEEAVAQRTAKSSPFAWINDVGARRLEKGFRQVDREQSSIRRELTARIPGAVETPLPEGFLVVERTRHELKAVTATDARLRIRKLPVPRKGSIEFWSNALANHLVSSRGYELVQQRMVRDGRGRSGRELTFDVVTGGTPTRYLTTLFVKRQPFWSRTDSVEVTEFIAPRQEFDSYVTAFHESRAWRVVDGPKPVDPAVAARTNRGTADMLRGQSQQAQSSRAFSSRQKSR